MYAVFRRASLIGKAVDLKSTAVKRFGVRVPGPPPGNIHRNTALFLTQTVSLTKKTS